MHRNRTWLLDPIELRTQRNRILPIEGGDGSTLSLDFTTGVLDPRMTFTRSSTATYIGADGLVKTMAAAPTNDPTKARFDHDPTTLAPRGLLVEGQVATLNSWGEDYTNAYWAKVGSSVGATSVAGPDNVSTATRRIVESATTAQHGIRRGIATTAGQTYTVSVFVKPGSYDSFGFELFWSASYSAKAEVTSISGNTQTVTSASGVDATLTRTVLTASGWYRYALTFTHPLAVGAATPDFNVLVKQTAAYAGNGTNYMDVYGFMLEAGSGASSYIPTGSSAGTREQDTASFADAAAIGFDRRKGTLYFSGTQFKHASSFARSVRLAAAPGGSEPMGIAVNGSTFYGTARDASFVAFGDAIRTNTLLQPFAFAVAFNADTPSSVLRGSLNGSSVSVTQSSAAAPPTAAAVSMDLNSGSSATAYASMAIRSVKFWPTDKSLSELTSITS